MLEIDGDAISIVHQYGGVLVHQVNCRRIAGAGIALAIRRQWPHWFLTYSTQYLALGAATLIRVQAKPVAYVASIYAQDGIGAYSRQTNYEAFATALDKLQVLLTPVTTLPVYVPYKIGCGLGGGDWDKIRGILEDKLPNATIVRLRR